MIGYEQLRIVSPYRLKSIEDVELNWAPNEHGKLIVRGLVDEKDQTNAVLKATADDAIQVLEQGTTGEHTIFRGIISSVRTIHRSGVYQLEIEASSGTSLLDVRKKRRSFQDPNMTYGALVKQVLSSYDGSDVIHLVGKEERIGEPIVQYDETDWELLKRIASHFQTVIISDILEAKPRIYIGVPKGNRIQLPENIPYTASKNLMAYRQAGEASSGLHHTDFFNYEIRSGTRYSIGDEVRFRDKTMVIGEVKAAMTQGDFLYTYRLARKEGIRQNRIHNQKLIGITINGEVLDVKGEKVKLHLDIDKEQSKSAAYWFPFAPPTGNVMYCMPKVGTNASLYFPDDAGGKAKVTGCVRTNGDSCQKTGNPNNRYFGTEHGSELEMTPTAINIASGSPEPLKITFDDETGVTLTSHKKLSINAGQDISLYTPKKIVIKAPNLIVAKKLSKLSGFTIESEYHFLGDQINKNGSDRTSYPKYDDEPATWTPPQPEPKPKFKWGKLFGIVAAAVAVVALVAVSVATFGAGAVLAAAAFGAACGAIGAVASTAASDIARGEMSSGWDYLKSALIGGGVGAISGAIFGPFGGSLTSSLMPATTSQVTAQLATGVGIGFAGGYTDYTTTELINGRTPTLSGALNAGMTGGLFAGAFSALSGPVSKFLSRAFQKGKTYDPYTGPKPDSSKSQKSKGGPGVDRPIDEFDDTLFYKNVEESRARATVEPKLPSDKELNDAVNEWSKMQKNLAPSKRKLDNFNTASVAYDAGTGKYYYGMNKGVQLSGDVKNPMLFGSKDQAGILPKASLNDYAIGNCAEVDAVNQALNNGANMGDLYLYTIKTTSNEFGVAKIACENCTFTFKGNVADALTGWLKGGQ
ncbi:contractile injection system protein, VgrG/Pvc8 family [Paenibacillus sp. VCA1]|uniref:contractile injection system protein, VgrG/Pvc8 family n=1 Tax=Paenibacillus sp. VCA1 TaxID=3039148 RepID=UPI0028724EED|nr:contractile injection system protein, VgrG/Pvc8 family [Paenibacillus sp. VCA1]MDR9856626.1 contractile injection system protein, VgrG/Pvc8 family [Paenibacillus sp. VCA1]